MVAHILAVVVASLLSLLSECPVRAVQEEFVVDSLAGRGAVRGKSGQIVERKSRVESSSQFFKHGEQQAKSGAWLRMLSGVGVYRGIKNLVAEAVFGSVDRQPQKSHHVLG
jgi:hypothetical protein